MNEEHPAIKFGEFFRKNVSGLDYNVRSFVGLSTKDINLLEMGVLPTEFDEDLLLILTRFIDPSSVKYFVKLGRAAIAADRLTYHDVITKSHLKNLSLFYGSSTLQDVITLNADQMDRIKDIVLEKPNQKPNKEQEGRKIDV